MSSGWTGLNRYYPGSYLHPWLILGAAEKVRNLCVELFNTVEIADIFLMAHMDVINMSIQRRTPTKIPPKCIFPGPGKILSLGADVCENPGKFTWQKNISSNCGNTSPTQAFDPLFL